jgi:hypothetical protein
LDLFDQVGDFAIFNHFLEPVFGAAVRYATP